MLYIGVGVFVGLAVFTARSTWTTWQERSGDERAAAVFDLVAARTRPRPTDAPGAMAWLRLELDRFGGREHDHVRQARYHSFSTGGDRVPESLVPLLAAMRAAPMTGDAAPDATWSQPPPGATAERGSLREQRALEVAGHPVVFTRRRAASAAERAPQDAFLRRVVGPLVRARTELDRVLAASPLPSVPGERAPRPVRLYAVAEDGTLVSAPWAERAWPDTASHELALLSVRPGHPAFAPDEFFFGFDPASTAPQVAYSGFYLDVAGRGLVATILLPFTTADGWHAILALDLAFEIDWRALARGVAPPVIGAALEIDGPGASWAAFAAALPIDAPDALRSALAGLAATAASAEDGSPLRHGVVDTGAVAAFQVSDRTWLLMVFPRASPAFPVVPLALLTGLLALLFTGFERNRRRADVERSKAQRAFAEKQNLLDTMQVPLVVVDPNTDVVVSSNRAAEAIGVRAGRSFAELVWPDDRAREHYQRMQVASAAPRRAYGVPVAVRDDDGHTVRRYAVIRSVAVTAQIEALAADERHRLGVVFVLDREADLALLAADIAGDARCEERRRLAGLLSHGVDALARVLEHVLDAPDRGADVRSFAAWLAEYLARRLTVTAWLLDHWDAEPPLAHDVAVDGAQAAATIARLASVFEVARGDRGLRARLHWDNGTLSGSACASVLDVAIDWPTDYVVTCPVRGGFGLFVGELVTNAVRHGRPATQPRVQLRCDRVRKELTLRIDNAMDPSRPPGQGSTYGGLAILRAMARLFEWREIACGPSGDRFVAAWTLPACEGGGAGDAD